MAAIEVQASTSQRTYLARLITNLFAVGGNIATPSDEYNRNPRLASCELSGELVF